eukprot:scaffold2076_cov69-Skeletonema_dohrnii-CCMP3373.AAC.6
MTREDVLRTLFTDAKLLQIWAICPYGGIGPMLRRFLFGDDPIRPLSFTTNRPQAARMYLESLQSSALRMAFFHLQTHRGLPPNPPIRISTATPTPHPPQESTSSNSSASPAPKRSPSAYGDQPVPSSPPPQASSGTARAPPGLSSPFSTDPWV